MALRNDVYQVFGEGEDTIRVLAVLDDGKIVVISLVRENTLPYMISADFLEDSISSGTAKKTFEYPVSMIVEPSEKMIRDALEKWEIIREFVQDEPNCYDKNIRKRFISVVAERYGWQRVQVQRILYRYWAGGMNLHALCSKYRERPGADRKITKQQGRPVVYETANKRMNIGQQQINQIRVCVNKYYNKQNGDSLHGTYRKFRDEYYRDPETGQFAESYPTLNQFCYHAHKFIDERKRHGKKYNKDFRAITGSSRSEAYGPGDTYQIDATIADVYLVSEENRDELVGRPMLYFVTDVFSRMIVGMHVSLKPASWPVARQTLMNTFMNKKEYCEKYDVRISEDEWPCCGLPRTLIVDNGELISKGSDTIISGLGITVKNEPAYRPDLKGIIESQFRLLNIDQKADMPGSVKQSYGERGSRDNRLEARLDLNQFTKVVILFVLGHNNRIMKEHPQPLYDVMEDRVPAIPMEIWNWGIKKRTGSLQQMNSDEVAIALAERGTAKVTKKGIQLKKLFYECPSAIKDGWFSKARMNGSWEIKIAYLPYDLEKIYWIKGTRSYEVCTLTSDSRKTGYGRSIDELEWQNRMESQLRAEYIDAAEQKKSEYDQQIKGVYEEAEQKQNLVSLDQYRPVVKTKQIRENRQKEISRLEKDEHDMETVPVIDEKPKTTQPTTYYGKLFAQFQEEDEQ